MVRNLVTKALLGAALIAAPTLTAQQQAQAAELGFDFKQDIDDEDYKTIVFPFVNAMRYTFVGPAAPMGIMGFNVGLAVTGAQVSDEAIDKAKEYTDGETKLPPLLAYPKLTAQKGLPFGIDLGLNVAMVPSTDIILLGGALQWAPLDGPFPIPSVAIRLGHTSLLGLDQLVAQVTNFEAIASLGVPPGVNIVTPYIGGGAAWASATSEFSVTTPIIGTSNDIKEEASWQDLYGVLGLEVSVFPFVKLAVEAQASAEQTTFSAKLSGGI